MDLLRLAEIYQIKGSKGNINTANCVIGVGRGAEQGAIRVLNAAAEGVFLIKTTVFLVTETVSLITDAKFLAQAGAEFVGIAGFLAGKAGKLFSFAKS